MSRNIPPYAYYKAVLALFTGILCSASAFAQLPKQLLDEIKGITLLETDRQNVKTLLTPGSFTVFENAHSDEFFRENYNISVSYSSGECRDTQTTEDDWFLGPDVWNVDQDRVVAVTIEPKSRPLLSSLGMDTSNLTKEKRYPHRDSLYIYFNKELGVAVSTMGKSVQSILMFPQKKDQSHLCSNDKVRRYFRTGKWRFNHIPKLICVLLNLPGNVDDVKLSAINGDSRQMTVSVSASDPENDVQTYMYKVSGGHLIGGGKNVTWDLKDEKPGTYTIISAVDDGTGPSGKFISKTIVID